MAFCAFVRDYKKRNGYSNKTIANIIGKKNGQSVLNIIAEKNFNGDLDEMKSALTKADGMIHTEGILEELTVGGHNLNNLPEEEKMRFECAMRCCAEMSCDRELSDDEIVARAFNIANSYIEYVMNGYMIHKEKKIKQSSIEDAINKSE